MFLIGHKRRAIFFDDKNSQKSGGGGSIFSHGVKKTKKPSNSAKRFGNMDSIHHDSHYQLLFGNQYSGKPKIAPIT